MTRRQAVAYAPGAVAIVAGLLAQDVALVMAGCAWWCGVCTHRLWDAWKRGFYR